MFTDCVENFEIAHTAPALEAAGQSAIFASIAEAIAELQAGRMIVIVDDEDRENEGDLMIAAEMITPEAINFMATHARGLICLAITGERADALELGPMASRNTSCVRSRSMRRDQASQREFPHTTVPGRSWRQSTQVRALKIWQGRATSSRFVPAGMAYWNGEAIRKRRSTSLVLVD